MKVGQFAVACLCGVALAAGAEAEEIILSDVRGARNDITGDVSVTKVGNGSYTIGGDLTFSGALTAKAGTLRIEVPQAEAPTPKNYKWFRLSIAATSDGEATVRLRQIGLYNEAGNRQNATMTAIDGFDTAGSTNLLANLASPAAGQVNYDKSMEGRYVAVKTETGNNPSSGLSASFNNRYSSAPCWNVSILSKNESGAFEVVKLDRTDPSTWIKIVMHLPDSADPIRRFDIQRFAQTDTLVPTRMMMEGSLDGQHWDIVWSNLDTVNHPNPIKETSKENFNCWLSDDLPGVSNQTRPSGTGYDLVFESKYFSWYRMSFAKLGNDAEGFYRVNIREICLFDKNGNRRNIKLRARLGDEPKRKLHNAYVADFINPGEVGYGVSASDKTVEVPDEETSYGASEFQACFWNMFSTRTGLETVFSAYWRWQTSTERTEAETQCRPTPSDESTWIPLVMHLVEPVEITHFDIQAHGNNTYCKRWPSQIVLEGSCNGTDWVTLFSNANPDGHAEFDYTARGGSTFDTLESNTCNMWLSDGKSAVNDQGPDANAYLARVLGEGWQLTRTTAETPAVTEGQLTQVASVEVKGGATIEATHPLELRSLTIDGTDAGTLKGFAFAQTGTINLTKAPSEGLVPLAFENCTGIENLANWEILYRGNPSPSRSVVVENGRLTIRNEALIIFLK